MFISVLQLPELSFLFFHVSLISVPNSNIYSELRMRPFKVAFNRISKSVTDGPIVLWTSSILLVSTVDPPYW